MFTRSTALVVTCLLLALAPVCVAMAEDGANGKKNAILDESCYWRYHFTYGPVRINSDRLNAAFEEEIGKRSFGHLRKSIQRRLKRQGKPTDGWMKDVIYVGAGGGWSFSGSDVMAYYRTDPPPSVWMKPDFDDADWLRQRTPYLVGNFYDSKHMSVRMACLRATFQVSDPAAVQKLVFSAIYRGGIRVFVNGREVVRQHLPKGDLSPDAIADVYPRDAYVLKKGEYREEDYDVKKNPQWSKRMVNGLLLVEELPLSFDSMKSLKGRPPEFRYKGSFGTNKAGFDRVSALRNRTVKVPVPANLLRKGRNVLAIELRGTHIDPLGTQWGKPYVMDCRWHHIMLPKVSLVAEHGSVTSLTQRPKGVQVWVEDMHRRVFDPDFVDPGEPSGSIRLVGARNGTYGAQIAIGTDKDLGAVKVSVGAIKQVDGKGGIPSTSVRVMYGVPHRLTELKVGDRGRRIGNSPAFDYRQVTETRYRNILPEPLPPKPAKPPRNWRPPAVIDHVRFFDHLSNTPTSKIAAKRTHAVWVSVSVPKDAVPGKYKGSVTVAAEGTQAVEIPLALEVFDWALPDSKEFQMFMALEQAPYCVAEQYKVKLWSEEHWQLLEASMRHLGRLGNDWWNIPVLSNTEFGNRDDAMVRVIRSKGGGYMLDFTQCDRYLDLAIKYCGTPQVINFIVMHPGRPGDGRMSPSPMEMHILDEATGKLEAIRVDMHMPEAERRVLWKQVSTGIYRHMQKRGLERAMYWGYTWDGPGVDLAMFPMLAEFVPGVYWTKGCHGHSGTDKWFKAVALVYAGRYAVGLNSKKGWKSDHLVLAYPRYWGNIVDCSDYSTPFSYRFLPDRAIVAGTRGIGRMGLDYWGNVYLRGLKGGQYAVGVPNLFLVWPGPKGAETGMRFEVFCEGVQEAEARIFLEQALNKLAPPPPPQAKGKPATTPPVSKHQGLVDRVRKVLYQHNYETLLDPPRASRYQLAESCAQRWRERSRDLYKAAADVAAVIGVDLKETHVTANIPARGKTKISLKLRNWTNETRDWKVAVENLPPPSPPARRRGPLPQYQTAKEPWVVLGANEGKSVPGMQELVLTLDGSKLEPDKRVRAKISLTDVKSSRSESVLVTGIVGSVFSFKGVRSGFNVAPGGKQSQVFTVFNHSGTPLDWKLSAVSCSPPAPPSKDVKKDPDTPKSPQVHKPVEWIQAEPNAGKLSPGGQCTVTVTAAPKDVGRADHWTKLLLSESGGSKLEKRATVHVVPPYVAPKEKPAGEAVSVHELPKGVLKSYRDGRRRRGYYYKQGRPFSIGKVTYKGRTKVPSDDWKSYDKYFVALPNQEVVYNVEGKGFTAFSAEVGPTSGLDSPVNMAWAHGLKLHFEIRVDGKLVAGSGMMGLAERPRLLAVTGLQNAKEVRLTARVNSDVNLHQKIGVWGNPVFHK